MPNDPAYLGLESGGSKVAAIVVDANFREIARTELRREPGHTAAETLETVLAAGDQALRAAGLNSANSLRAAGWGFGGGVDRKTMSPVQNLHEPGWESIDASHRLKQHLGCPVFIENDCNVAAVGEAHLGAGSPTGVSAFITVGSGIGAGITVDGRLFQASRFGEAELGHLVLGEGGPPCACGNTGCLEAFSSGDGMARLARFLAPDFQKSSLLARRIQESDTMVGLTPQLFDNYPDDPLARHLVDQACDKLGLACSILINLFVPGVIVFGGGVSRQPVIIPSVSRAIEGRVVCQLRARCSLKPAALGSMTVPLGAALHAALQSGNLSDPSLIAQSFRS